MDHASGSEADLSRVSGPDHGALTQDRYDPLVRTGKDGHHNLFLTVGGVHCAACIQKIESVLKKDPDIINARLNFSTKRLAIEWSGSTAKANEYVALIQDCGYKVEPWTIRSAAEEGPEDKFLLLCLGVAGFAMGNIMLLSVGLWSSSQAQMGVEMRDFLHWVSGLIAIPTIIFSGRPFFQSAYEALKRGGTNMDVPISVALVLTCGISLYETANHGDHAYFDSVVMLLFFLLIGRYLDFRARRQARGSAEKLLKSLSGFAEIERGNNIERLPVDVLSAGMIARVPLGTKFPADGVIIEGTTTVDTSIITGETFPVTAVPGSSVYAGTLNISAPVRMEIKCARASTLVTDIVNLLEKAEQAQDRYVRLAERIARLYTPVVHLLALSAFLGWILYGMMWPDALLIGATVLIITCPCALALAIPVVQVLATSQLMRSGIFVKSGDAYERLNNIDTILIDKTGTLTMGRATLCDPEQYRPDIIKLARSIASYSHHPLSRAIFNAAEGDLYHLDHVTEIPGKGMSAFLDGIPVKLGLPSWCGHIDEKETEGSLNLCLQKGPDYFMFYFQDSVYTDVAETISAFKKHGLTTILISGDRKSVVEDVAEKAGIQECHASFTPAQKYDFLLKLKQEGKNILMIGDGINDAPSLAAAHVSMSPSDATDLAQNAADIVYQSGGLASVLKAYRTARFSQVLVKQNLFMTFLYNICALPLAVAGYVTPLLAALMMSGSSLAVVANAFRLKWKKL